MMRSEWVVIRLAVWLGTRFRARNHRLLPHCSGRLKRYKGGSHHQVAGCCRMRSRRALTHAWPQSTATSIGVAPEPHLANPFEDVASYECDSLVHLLVRDLQAIGVDHSVGEIIPCNSSSIACPQPPGLCATR